MGLQGNIPVLVRPPRVLRIDGLASEAAEATVEDEWLLAADDKLVTLGRSGERKGEVDDGKLVLVFVHTGYDQR